MLLPESAPTPVPTTEELAANLLSIETVPSARYLTRNISQVEAAVIALPLPKSSVPQNRPVTRISPLLSTLILCASAAPLTMSLDFDQSWSPVGENLTTNTAAWGYPEPELPAAA